MRRPVKILLAGAMLALPMAPLSSVAATSSVNNTQVQLGDVFATQTLNVVAVTDGTSAVTSSTGNGLLASVVSGSLDVQSNQSTAPKPADTVNNLPGEPGVISATTHLNATQNLGAGASVVTAATGNTAEADSLGGGALTGYIVQSSTGPTIKSDNDINASTAEAGSLSTVSQAIANSISSGVVGGSSHLTTQQTSTTDVTAASASDSSPAGATLMYTAGAVSLTAIGVANNLTATGTSGAAQAIQTTQSSSGGVHAYQYAVVSNGEGIASEATATGNNTSVSNESADLSVTNDQTNNGGFIFAESGISAYEFGSAQSVSSGVGNSFMAANVGPSTEVWNTQNNGGEVDSTSNVSGGAVGYDGANSATAIGNGATAFACSECGGTIFASNSQTNSNGVSATATTDLIGTNRSVSTVATAVGNTASFYVTKTR
jgi:hypothetical protein